jgi:SAM-dependent methyltransferase
MEKKFNPSHLEKLNNPDRLKNLPPDFIWNKLAMDKCQTIIDIGAGTGLFSQAFYNLMGEGTVYAADISADMVDWMESNEAEKSLGLVPVLMSENEVPLDSGEADLILMFNLYHELESPLTLLKETRRLLRPGGKICIADWKKGNTPMGPPQEIRVEASEITAQLAETGYTHINSDLSLPYHSLVWAEK